MSFGLMWNSGNHQWRCARGPKASALRRICLAISPAASGRVRVIEGQSSKRCSQSSEKSVRFRTCSSTRGRFHAPGVSSFCTTGNATKAHHAFSASSGERRRYRRRPCPVAYRRDDGVQVASWTFPAAAREGCLPIPSPGRTGNSTEKRRETKDRVLRFKRLRIRQ